MTEAAIPNAATARDGSGSGRGQRALQWWTRHVGPEADPATRARLRRCRSSTDALTIPAAVSLVRQLGLVRESGDTADLHLIAGLDLARVLSHVKQHDAAKRPMQAAGWKRFPGERRESDAGEDRPLLSEARFRRLVQAGRGEEQVAAFSRLLDLLGGVVNVTALAEDYIYWNDRTKRRWAFDYYAAASATPPDSDPANEELDG